MSCAQNVAISQQYLNRVRLILVFAGRRRSALEALGVAEAPRMNRSTALAAVAVVVILVLAAFAVVLFLLEDESEQTMGTLRIGVMEEVDSLNPFIGMSPTSMLLYGLVYDCLQGVGEDMETESNLATSWMVDDDYGPYGSAWQYNLTENARWHDGVPLDADDVVFTLNLHALNFGSVWANHPYAYFIDHAEAIDDHAVRVHFADRSTGEPMPVAFADELLIPIMPKHMLENMTVTDIAFSWTGIFEGNDPLIVGTGPFMATDEIYAEFEQGDRITLVRNPEYHRAADRGEQTWLDKIVICQYDDEYKLALALETGNLDVAALPPSAFSTMNDKVESGQLQLVYTVGGPSCAQRQLLLAFGLGVDMFGRTPSPLLADNAVRQAITMTTNRSIAVDDYYLGAASEGSSLISPCSGEWHFEIPDPMEFDLDAAAELLEENGYRYTTGSPDVRVATADSLPVVNEWVEENASLTFSVVLMPDDYDLKTVVEAWASDWSDIGVAIDLEAFSGPLVPITPPVSDLKFVKVAWNDPDPNCILYQQSSCALYGWNYNGYSNESYDDCYLDSVSEMDPELRCESVKECQRIHYQDAGVIVLAYPNQTYAYRTDTFEGWGDWEAHPGRSLDAVWGGNQLYFDLEYITSTDRAELFVPMVVAAAVGTTVAAAARSIFGRPSEARINDTRS